MVKKFVKSMLTLGLLLSISHFQLRSESPVMLNLDSYLQPEDYKFLEQDGPMVFMTKGVIQLIVGMSSMNQTVMDLVGHVKEGYQVAPEAAVKLAVEELMKAADVCKADREILAEYHKELVNGNALIEEDAAPNRRENKKIFCRICANFAALGCALVKTNLTVCGSVAAGAFTGATGGIAVSGINAAGNVQFNAAGINELDVQGAVEAFVRNIRGTVAFSSSAITLTSVAPNTPVIMGGILPTASIFRGTGYTLGQIIGVASSKALASTTAAGSAYSYMISFQVPVIFSTPYRISPTVLLGFERLTPGGHGLVDANSSAVSAPAITSQAVSSVVFNIVFNIVSQGATYADANANAATTVNSIFAGGRLLNFLCQGPVA
jgi:hypothetical protein